jgi:predicted DNA-binding transcriptional regulator YafY
VVEQQSTGTIFSIDVIPNFELERVLLGFGDGLKVLSPNSLVKVMRRISTGMKEIYE